MGKQDERCQRGEGHGWESGLLVWVQVFGKNDVALEGGTSIISYLHAGNR